MGALYNIKRKLKNYPSFWRYAINFGPSMAYTLGGGKSSSDEVKRVVNDLKKNGVALSSVDALFPDKSTYMELEAEVMKMEAEQKQMIDEFRANANNQTAINEKSFMLFLLDRHYRPESIFAKYALQQPFRQIANQYYSMKDAELRYYDIWHTVPYNGEARTSQLWHRDREDLQILKIFTYFTDVTAGAGPFTYAPGTHILGPVQTEPEYHIEEGVKRTVDEQMAKIVPADKWFTAIVPKGTIAFADTHGYHKGGLAREDDRLLYTCMYTSPGCERFLFDNPQDVKMN